MVDIPKMSETIDKALDTVKAVTTEPVVKAVNQRLSNPFFLCFISSWVLCNWDRVLLLLFSFSLDVEQRIEKIKALPSNSVFFGISIPHAHTFWYPFIASIIFIVCTPFISYIVDVIQNGVFTKKSTNDSNRYQNALDLKIKEINKNIEFEYADAKARLNAENERAALEYDTSSLEDKYNDAQVKLRDINIAIKEKENQAQALTNSYNNVMNSMSNVRLELDSKEKELIDLNSRIISNQNKLDSIKLEILSNTLPFTDNTVGALGTLGGLDGLKSSSSNMSRVGGYGPNIASEKLNKAASEPESIKTLKDLATDNINKNDNKKNK